jgi:hypothetical protein
MPGPEVEDSMHASIEDFDAAIAELEAIAGKRLNGPARLKIQEEFQKQPEAVRRLIREVRERTRRTTGTPVRNPHAVLWTMIEDGDHRVPREQATRLAPKLSWARKTAPLLSSEAREDVISTWDLSPADERLVRKAIEQSLRRAPAGEVA